MADTLLEIRNLKKSFGAVTATDNVSLAIERGELHSNALKACLRGHLQPLKESGADVLVLGCTHYVFLRELIAAEMGPSCTLVDTGAAVAAQLERQLAMADLLAPSDNAIVLPSVRIFTSGDVAVVGASLRALCGQMGAALIYAP